MKRKSLTSEIESELVFLQAAEDKNKKINSVPFV